MRSLAIVALLLLADCAAGGRPWIVVNNISVEQAEEQEVVSRRPVVRTRR